MRGTKTTWTSGHDLRSVYLARHTVRAGAAAELREVPSLPEPPSTGPGPGTAALRGAPAEARHTADRGRGRITDLVMSIECSICSLLIWLNGY